MAANVREIELALQVSTSNVDAIRNLQADVTKLAKSSSDAAPEFQKLSTELDKLAQDAVGLQKLTEAATSVDRMAAAQGAAAARARELTDAYNGLKAKTDDAAAAQASAKGAYDQAKSATAALGDAIKQLKADNTGAARETDTYKTELKDLITQQIASRGATRELKTAYDEAKGSTAAARTEQGALSNEYRNSTAQATALSAKLQTQQAEYADLARATLGVSTAQVDLISSGANLVASLNAIRTAVQATAAEEQRAALAKKAAAAEDERIAARALAISQQQQAQAKAEADGIIRDYARMEAAQKQAAATAKQAADAMASAFGTVGVKSVKDLEAKILETRNAMQLLVTGGNLTGGALKTAMAQGETAIKGLEREIRAATGSLTTMDKATNLWNQSMGGMKVGTLAAAAAISSVVQRVAELGPAMVGAISKNENLTQSLNNIFKSGELAANQIRFLRQSANDAGVAVSQIQQSFVKFSAAMTGANIPLDQSNALFSQLTKASGSLGLSTDAVSRAMEALGQMASKGTVSMEELRQQLGDALPGALGIAAKGLGITEAEVIKLVSSGQLAAKDFFPAFTEGLKSISGEANTLSQNFERLKNGISAIFIAIGDAGALDVMKGALFGLGEAAKLAGVILVTLTEGISTVIRMAAAASGALMGGGGLKGAFEAITQVASDSRDRLEKLGSELYNTEKATQATTVSATNNAASLANMSSEAAAASKELLKLTLDTAKQADALDHAADMAEADTKATETLSGAKVQATKGIGDLRLAIESEIEAHTANVASLEKLAAARQAEVDLLADQFSKTKLLLEADGMLDKADAERLQVMALEIEKRAQVVAGIQAKITATREDLVQSELEKQMLQDNSDRLYELRGRYYEATEAVRALQEQKAKGLQVDEALTLATKEQADASKLLNDAHSDTIAKLQAKQITQKADNELQQSALQLQLAQYDSLLSLAKSIGDTNLQRQAEIGKLEIQIKMSEAHARAMIAEADGNIAIAQATMAQLEALGQLDPVKRATIEAAIKNAEAQKNTAAAMLETNKTLEHQLTALRNGTSGLDSHAGASGRAGAAQDKFGNDTSRATAALEAQNAALERNISAQEKANDLKERAAALERVRKNVDKEGFSQNTAGQRINESVPAVDGLYQQLVAGGMEPGEANRKAQVLAKQAQDAMSSASRLTSGGIGGIGSPFNQKTMQEHVNDALRESAVAKSGAGATANPTAGAAKTYNVTFGGQTVKTASDADAQKLMGMLKQAKGSA